MDTSVNIHFLAKLHTIMATDYIQHSAASNHHRLLLLVPQTSLCCFHPALWHAALQ